ncbi:Holliday junction resolvase [compost metagenome]
MLPGQPGSDAADALGVAICHANGSDTLGTLSGLAPDLVRKGMRVRRGRLVG